MWQKAVVGSGRHKLNAHPSVHQVRVQIDRIDRIRNKDLYGASEQLLGCAGVLLGSRRNEDALMRNGFLIDHLRDPLSKKGLTPFTGVALETLETLLPLYIQ